MWLDYINDNTFEPLWFEGDPTPLTVEDIVLVELDEVENEEFQNDIDNCNYDENDDDDANHYENIHYDDDLNNVDEESDDDEQIFNK